MDKDVARVAFIVTKTIDFLLYMTIFSLLVLGKEIDWGVAMGLVFFYGLATDLTGRFSMMLQGYKKYER